MQIRQLCISNFRGIQSFDEMFDQNMICLVGRGDTGKTTILEAISYVLSPAWNLSFNDTDFYNCDIESNIEIVVTISNVPERLWADENYGLYFRLISNETGEIIDELEDEGERVLTIKLTIDKSLEPKWVVTDNRPHDDKPISASHRGELNCFMISDYVDRHFSWNKGNPLHALKRLKETSFSPQNNNVVIDALREAKASIDENEFAELSSTVDLVIEQATLIGLDISNTKTSLDHRELTIGDGRVCLHDENIPFRLKGKGSKRLASIAIQSVLTNSGGIVLVDEIEQGLEPDRIKQLARSLKENNRGQIILTTHSRDVVTELDVGDLVVVRNNYVNGSVEVSTLGYDKNGLQGVVRACPEGFFSKRVIVCEGATEVGLCRALDRYRVSKSQSVMSFNDCSYVDGTGSEFPNRAVAIRKVGLEVAVLCDSDAALTPSKDELEKADISVIDCEEGLCLEQQVFNDLPWEAIQELLAYVMQVHNKTEQSLRDSVSAKYDGDFPVDWMLEDTLEMRSALAASSVVKKKEWFKTIYLGEALGDLIFRHIASIEGTRLEAMINGLSGWVDQ